MTMEKIVDNSASGRIDIYANGMNGRPDGWGHDHIWLHGSPSGPFSGHLEDRSAHREAMARALGHTAIQGY